MTFDSARNLYFADQNNHEIRMISGTTGLLSGIAGITAKGGKAGDAGPAIAANLTNPTQQVLDSSGNLYIADKGNHAVRMVYAAGAQAAALITLENPTVTAPVAGNIYTIAGVLGSSGTGADGILATSSKLNTPVGVALDAENNVYVSNSGNATSSTANNSYYVIRRVSSTNGLITTLAGFVGGAGYAGDGGPATLALLNSSQVLDLASNGVITFSDSNNYAIRSLGPGGALTFASSALGKLSANSTATLTNVGSGVLNFPQGMPVIAGANPSEFSIASGGTCNWTSLQPNGSCTLNVGFTPVVGGPRSATATIATDGSPAAVTIALGGNGLYTSTTTLTTSATGGGTGQSATATLTAVVGPSTQATPTGTVAFLDGTTALGSVYLSGGTATLTTNALAAGNHTISANYTGDTKFTVSTASKALAIAIGTVPLTATTTALKSQYSLVAEGSPITLTATVSSTGATVGTVNFYDGATSLGAGTQVFTTATPPVATNVWTFVASPATGGTHIYTAQFTGITTFNPSISAGVTVGVVAVPTFVFQAVNGTVYTVQTGSRLKVAFNLNPYDSYQGTVTFACGTLPASMHCVFTPVTATFNAAVLPGSTPITLEITTDDSTNPSTILGAYLPGAWLLILLLGLGGARLRRFRGVSGGLLSVALLGALFATEGCGGGNAVPASASATLTATGNYNVAVSALISVNGQPVASTTNLTIQVTN